MIFVISWRDPPPLESKDNTIDTDEMSSDAIIAIETTSMHVDDDPRNITSLSFVRPGIKGFVYKV
jgi:hypothetical protein